MRRIAPGFTASALTSQQKTFESLKTKTKDKAQAQRLQLAMNEAGKQPAMNLGLARVYLKHSDPMVTRCPRQFAHQPVEHETLLGRLPLAGRGARMLLQQVRPWIEPAQSFEKNQLGLSGVFLNSLRFTWVM